MPDTVQPRSKKDPTAIPPRSAQHPAAPTSPLAHGADFPVVAIGASTGGLEACRKLLDALPADTAMAFILVQHLDSTQDSLLVDLLAERTALTVLQATDGMPVEPGHLYVIPPGTYLSVKGGALRLSQPTAPRGARLPFDFLLHSLADRQRRAGAQPRPGPRPVHRATARRDAGAPRPRPVPAGQGIRCSPSRSRASRTGVRQRRRRRLRPVASGNTEAPKDTPGDVPGDVPMDVPRVAPGDASRTDSILVIEDDPDLRSMLQLMLGAEGHRVTAAPDGPAALDMVARGALRPDLVLTDCNLPGGMSGLQAAARLREKMPGIPVIVLTGDTRAGTLADIAGQDCVHLGKPVRPQDLARAIQDIRPARPVPLSGTPGAAEDAPVVFVVDDDSGVRAALRSVLEADGVLVEDYAGGEAFLAAYRPGRDACLLVDAAMPGMDGLELLRRLAEAGHRLPAIMITGHGDVATAVGAMKAGALDFVEKPVRAPDLLASIARALDQSHGAGERAAWRAAAVASIAGLTGRQRDIMALVLAGQPSKNIAADLGISQRTVENHRAAIMRKTGATSLPALARLALAATV